VAGLTALIAFSALLRPRAASAQNVNLSINTMFVATTLPTGGVGSNSNFCVASLGAPVQFFCPVAEQTGSPTVGFSYTFGDISNDPEINFATNYDQGPTSIPNRCNITNTALGQTYPTGPTSALPYGNPSSSLLPFGDTGFNICNSQVYLCAQICAIGGSTAAPISVDQIEFDVFRFVDGANPNDPSSTPPLRTFYVNSPGSIDDVNNNCVPEGAPFGADPPASCVLWDGSQSVAGVFGKINGQYGFRVTATTNQQGQSGNIQITATESYPQGATYNGNNPSQVVPQEPITVNVTDVHVINSTPTVVGKITGVSAEPYNFTYRLSKAATMYITINESVPNGNTYVDIRDVLSVNGEPEPGEGNLTGTTSTALVDGSSWDGRDNNGNIEPPGTYLAVFQALSDNGYTAAPYVYSVNGDTMRGDLSVPTTYTIGLDPLQITDIQVAPLLGGATALAVMSYVLTEPATVYVDIYPPGTQFCNDSTNSPALSDVNQAATDPVNQLPVAESAPPAKWFQAAFACGANGMNESVTPLRSISQFQTSRTSVISFWDGRDLNGNLLNDGDYVFVIYAALPSQKGFLYNGSASDKRIWTSNAKTGFISVVRGLVGITQITPTSTVIGSSPAVAGLSPFTFSYQLSRPAIASVLIYDQTGTNLIKTLVSNETRAGQTTITEVWQDGIGDNGLYVSSGTYLVQLTVYDPTFPAKVSTTTAQFPVDLWRVTDVVTTPLLSVVGDTATLSYQLSEPMNIAWNIYPPGSVVVNSSSTWPPCASQTPPNACTSGSVVSPLGAPVAPIITFYGMRPGRLKITESWSGQNPLGIFVQDGQYVWTLTAQSSTTPMNYPSDHIYGTVTVARGSVLFTSFNVIPTIPTLFNSSSTLTLDPFSIQYALTRQSSVTITILTSNNPPTLLTTVVSGGVRPAGILNTDVWDGRDQNGNLLPVPISGGGTAYIVQAVALDIASTFTQPSTAQVTITYDPLRIYDLAVTPIVNGGSAIIAYQVSEAMKVSLKIYQPGTIFDAAGDPAPPDSVSLVKVITGLRPSRTNIKDTWDGTNLTGTKVQEGDYKFRLVGSTDTSAIDTQSGNVIFGSELADDRLIDDIPVTIGSSSDPLGDLNANSFVYPNPIPAGASSATFQVYNPFPHAHITMRLYTLSGRLVMTQDFGSGLAPSYQNGTTNPNGAYAFTWYKSNQSGRTVARGVYYALLRVEQQQEGTAVLQTIKKVLVQ
jgi:flagellar hook assembly protein FlgD